MSPLPATAMRFVVLRQAETGRPARPLPLLAPSSDIAVEAAADLAPPAQAVRFVFDGDRVEEAPGSFIREEAALAGLAVIEAPSREAAVAWLAAQPDGQAFELREVGCAAGLAGVPPRAPGALPRFLIVVRSDTDTEAETPPPQERLDRMARRNDEAVRDGLLIAGDGLRSTARATRVAVAGGRARIVDGPFAEAKELVAGFWLVQAPSLEDVLAWVRRYPYAQARPEVEVRPVLG